MKIKCTSVSYARKFNLGDFESVEVSVFYHAEVDDDEEGEDVNLHLVEIAKHSVKLAVKPILEASQHQVDKAQITRKFMGKKVKEDENDKAPF